MATTAKTRSSLWFVVLLALTVYALTSVGIAVANDEACGGPSAARTWQLFPPGWECGPARLPGQQ
ncbi:MAG TPA: hypothetical protein PKA98_04695 [Acidimicrobiales bacterium]|nr:hypothetical protein [Acidimicrobiales bacterium]